MQSIVQSLSQVFEQYANTDDAIQMEAYMKNHFVFYGVKSPVRKSILSPFNKEIKRLSPTDFKKFIKSCWKKEEREWQYIAMEAMKRYQSTMDESFIKLTENLIVNKSWWDTVDFLAATILGHLFLKFPEQRHSAIERYMSSDNMWLERSALLHQLKYKDNTDSELLSALIGAKKHDKEFFIQKAIGWSLRQYSKFNAAKVKEILAIHPELSNLAKREASKYLQEINKTK